MAVLASLRMYLLPVKIDPLEKRRLEAAILLNGGGVAHTPEDSDLLLTVLKGRSRIAMTISKEIMNTKPLINLKYLEDSLVHRQLLDYRPYLVPADDHPDPESLEIPHALEQSTIDYSSSDSGSETEISRLTSRSSSPVPPPAPAPPPLDDSPSRVSSRPATPVKHSLSHSAASFESPIPSKLARMSLKPDAEEEEKPPLPTPESFTFHPKTPLDSLPPEGKRINPEDLPRLACQRKSPLVCVNQPLLDELSVIIRWKEIGEDHKDFGVVDTHALSYQRACSAIKAYPTKLKSASEARKLPGVGEKIALVIGEFLKTGKIAKSQELRNDPRLRLLLLFQTLHNVGPSTARELYDKHECRSLEDVYNARPALRLELEYWGELQSKIPRGEVEEIAAFVSQTLEAISPGCGYTICGGYRRGKLFSNDVDLVFTHDSGDASRVNRHVLDRLVEEMTIAGALSDLVSGAHIGDGGHRTTTVNHSFCVLKLPGEGRVRRRVDIIFSAYSVYHCTVLGWSGSTMLERDIRRHAETLNLKFDSSGISNRTDGSKVLVDPKLGELGVWERLGLEWLEPTERCADV